MSPANRPTQRALHIVADGFQGNSSERLPERASGGAHGTHGAGRSPLRLPSLTGRVPSAFRSFLPEQGPGLRGCEEILNGACDPAVDAVRALNLVDSLYISKHVTEVWLTLFTNTSNAVSASSTTEPFLACFSFRSDHTQDPAREELLRSHCDSFRRCLDLMTTIALDIHRAPELHEHQKALIRIGRANRLDRSALEEDLRLRSSTFAALASPEQFWSTLSCNCLSGQATDCVHWLYNIVLGFDWRWDLPEAEIAQQVGLSWP